jgi:hypothetical protein
MSYYYCRFASPDRLAERMARRPRREWMPPNFNELGPPIPPSRNPWIGPLMFTYNCGPFSTKCFGSKPADLAMRSDRFLLTLETPEEASEFEKGHRPANVVDAPVDERSVLWRVTVYHHADGSAREVVRDVKLSEARLYILALIGLNAFDGQIRPEIESRLCDALGPVIVPAGLNWADCCGYPSASYGLDQWRPGLVDSLL